MRLQLFPQSKNRILALEWVQSVLLTETRQNLVVSVSHLEEARALLCNLSRQL
jgi:hypothetical protein